MPYLQVCEHVCQAELTEVVLVEDFKVFAPVLRAVFILEGGTGAKHHLDPGQLEVDVSQVPREHLLIVNLIDLLKMSLNQVCEVGDVAVIVFIKRLIYASKHLASSPLVLLSLDCVHID